MRYFARPRAYRPMYAEDETFTDALLPPLSVSDHEATDTGLLDKDGWTIWRAPNEVGFHNPKAGA